MSKYKESIISSENLNWAWRKARRLYRSGDGLYDFAEVAEFELDLESQLKSISNDFETGKYELAPLILLPQPKKPSKEGSIRMRQSFHISVRDQVAWLAITNVVGPTLDSKMPAWSYGHRLFKAAWFEQSDGKSHLEFGPYRHSSGHLYRRFKHSWPLFRRHISLTSRAMVNGLGDLHELDAAEQMALAQSERPDYFNPHFWPKAKSKTLHYASIDLEKFYPRIRTNAVVRSLSNFLDSFDQDLWLQKLVANLLSFHVTKKGSAFVDEEICEPLTISGDFDGLPTGLMVAGFLSNVAMLPVDSIVESKLRVEPVENRKVAHFRFVDDHAILAYDFASLCEWIRQYKSVLRAAGVGPEVSKDKYDPPELGAFIEGNEAENSTSKVDEEKIAKLTEINGANPSKLMTKTLTLVSELAGADFDILAEQAREQRLSELEWLLLADIPDREIRSDTRSAFAAGRIASLVPQAFSPSIELLREHRVLAKAKAARIKDTEEIKRSEERVREQRRIALDGYRKTIDHYFKLIFEAFSQYPEKPRLLLRTLDYCRATGQNGVGKVLRHIDSEVSQPTAYYLRGVALQAISRHIATAVLDLENSRLLFRQRKAATDYLTGLIGSNTLGILRTTIANCGPGIISKIAPHPLETAMSFLASALRGNDSLSAKFIKQIERLSEELNLPEFTARSAVWLSRTGSPIGAWAHWVDGLRESASMSPGRAWVLSSQQHQPSNKIDWLSLRKGPRYFPRRASNYLEQGGVELPESDGGWLAEQRVSRNAGQTLPRNAVGAFATLKKHSLELSEQETHVTLEQWIAHVLALPEYDPRGGEWTALEIVRQLLLGVKVFPTGSLESLDDLHPANVVLPKAWLDSSPPDRYAQKIWTWTAWKQFCRESEPAIKVLKNKIQDYRRQPAFYESNDPELQWYSRLRSVGLLVLDICRKDFSLPANWNVRGLERNIVAHVKLQLEQTAISSRTQSIVEAATLPRVAETDLIRRIPWAYFGAKENTVANDTATDPPFIRDVEQLVTEIRLAQTTLEEKQISVLHHAARQLIPMSAVQLTNVAIDLPNGDAVDER